MLETTQQSRSPVAPQTDPATHAECLEFVRAAIASNDRQTALDIKNVLADVCQNGYADRAAIWADLTDTEQQNFKELLALPPIAPLIKRVQAAQTWAEVESVWDGDLELKKQIKNQLPMAELKRVGKLYKQAQSQPEAQAEPTPTPEPAPEPAPEPTPTPETEPIALADNPQQPELAETTETEPTPTPEPEPETIAPEDAEKMREIALVWWPEMYPEILQTLITQMFGWQAPGTKYDAPTINAWLVTEDAIVRDRISELWLLKHGEGLDSLDCGF